MMHWCRLQLFCIYVDTCISDVIHCDNLLQPMTDSQMIVEQNWWSLQCTWHHFNTFRYIYKSYIGYLSRISLASRVCFTNQFRVCTLSWLVGGGVRDILVISPSIIVHHIHIWYMWIILLISPKCEPILSHTFELMLSFLFTFDCRVHRHAWPVLVHPLIRCPVFYRFDFGV